MGIDVDTVAWCNIFVVEGLKECLLACSRALASSEFVFATIVSRLVASSMAISGNAPNKALMRGSIVDPGIFCRVPSASPILGRARAGAFFGGPIASVRCIRFVELCQREGYCVIGSVMRKRKPVTVRQCAFWLGFLAFSHNVFLVGE
ncbi:MAG: hypothetical protein CM1200mP9_11060 [Gammaproteobacteria bacterium]|nr:MAG: hypothetical protein CM1200mP9_11060 [Gammaproteobacteria bacterium]